MRLTTIFVLFVLSLPAQVKPAPKRPVTHANADQLGLTCTEILQMASSDWIAKFTGEKGSDPPVTIRAINAYGKCYDARTDQLAAALVRSGKGPAASAKTNFQSMEQAVKDFTAKALTAPQPPADALKTAYAGLYEKQFRYEFYESYEPKPAVAPTLAATPGSASKPPANTPPANASNNTASSATAPGKDDAASSPSAAVVADLQNPPPLPNAKINDVDPVSQAKNQFGELLGDLPDDQMHQLHAAFGGILGPNAATSRMQLLVYRYAIFLLQQPGDKSFSPPPF
jgi:hypothetical protein